MKYFSNLTTANLRQADHLKSGSLFADPRFPPEESSLYYSRPARGLTWQRPGDICASPHLYVDGATRHDINQGELGNCWLLAAFSSLSDHRTKLEAVLPPGQSFTNNYAGIFLFRLGRWSPLTNIVFLVVVSYCLFVYQTLSIEYD